MTFQLAAVAARAVAQVQGDLSPAGRAGQRGHRVAGIVLRHRPESVISGNVTGSMSSGSAIGRVPGSGSASS